MIICVFKYFQIFITRILHFQEASRALSAAVIGGNLGATTYLELADAVEAAPANAHFHRQLLLAALADLLQCKAQPEVG